MTSKITWMDLMASKSDQTAVLFRHFILFVVSENWGIRNYTESIDYSKNYIYFGT